MPVMTGFDLELADPTPVIVPGKTRVRLSWSGAEHTVMRVSPFASGTVRLYLAPSRTGDKEFYVDGLRRIEGDGERVRWSRPNWRPERCGVAECGDYVEKVG